MENKNIYVKVPFHYGVHKFKVFKGHRWGVIDHFLLLEICDKSYSIDELSYKSNLPKRLIIEIILPFMKLGWVELTEIESKYYFKVTDIGRIVASYDELPYEREPYVSTRKFLIDPKTGQCYRVNMRNQNYQIYKKGRVNELIKSKSSISTELIINNPKHSAFTSDILDCVEDTDEEVISYEERVNDRPYKQNITYALALVDEADKITGVPQDISKELADDILAAANIKRKENKAQTISDKKIEKPSTFSTDSHEDFFEEHIIKNNDFSIISGASQHYEHLVEMINNAYSRIIIHSTFIQLKNFESIFKMLIISAKKGIQVDILWGQEEPDDEKTIGSYKQFLDGLSAYRDEIVNLGLTSLFTIHTDPTGSHSKIIVCDNLNSGYCATLGSCNWLASGFNRYECSVLIKEVSIVTEVLDILSIIARGRTRISNDFSKSISSLSHELKKTSILKKASSDAESNGCVKLKIVTKNEHHKFVLDARDNAEKMIFIASHRISDNADRPILTPLISSIKDNNEIDIRMYYSSLSGGLNKNRLTELSQDLKSVGIKLEKIKDPVSHAKILSWDSDNILISSLNWLSASSYGNPYDELGIYINSSNIFSHIENNFD